MNYQRIKNKVALVVSSRMEWHRWLEENHGDQKEIWLVYYKKHTGKPTLTKNDALEEALCYGWIDSLVQGLDEACYMQKFTPRKRGSPWSEANKKRVAILESQGLIQAAGLSVIAEAKHSGEWEKDHQRPGHAEFSGLLYDELEKSPEAKRGWETLPPSHQKKFLLWISQAKREATQQNRCKKAIIMLTSGKSPNML